MATINEFAAKIAKYKAELLALKTAHKRGLGVIDFSKKSITATSLPAQDDYGYDLTVGFTAGNIFPPILQLATTVGQVNRLAIDEANLQFTARINGDFSFYGKPTVEAVASAPIASITLTVRSSAQ